MSEKKILFISGSVGLGHIGRDISIANELRKLRPEIKIRWLAGQPASLMLKASGEELLPESALCGNNSRDMERASDGYRINVLRYALEGVYSWVKNFLIFARIVKKYDFSLYIGDETYEINAGYLLNPVLWKIPYVSIYDFFGLETVSANPLEIMGIYLANLGWTALDIFSFLDGRMSLFIGNEEDIPDRKIGLFLPNGREFARRHYKFLGYILRFDPELYADKDADKKKLGYGNNPLVIVSLGGTSIGKELLELSARAYPLMKEKIPDLKMVLVCGPRLSPRSLKLPDGIEVKGYVHNLYEYYAACDLAIVQGGATTTLELTALRKPFIYFPLENHCEQQISVVNRLQKWNAGIRMSFSKTNPEDLAEKVISTIGRKTSYAKIPIDGAAKAAQLISRLINKNAGGNSN